MAKYKDYVLAKNSKALELYENKEFKKLDSHLKQLEETKRKLESK